MKLFDIEKLAHSIVHPFQDILQQFTEQMDVLHKEVKLTNVLLDKLVTQNHKVGTMLEREMMYINDNTFSKEMRDLLEEIAAHSR